jgi:hypothetical protein
MFYIVAYCNELTLQSTYIAKQVLYNFYETVIKINKSLSLELGTLTPVLRTSIKLWNYLFQSV